MHSDELWSNNDYRYYLAHHGVLGQKWGQRNGPPYPLGSDISTGKRLKESAGAAIKKGKAAFDKAVETHKQKVAEKKAAKEEKKVKKAVASSEVEQIEKIKDKLSTREFEDAVKRAELNKRLQQSDTRKTKIERFTNVLNTASKVTGAGISAWNNLARLSNAFLDTDLPVVGDTGRKNKKEESDKNKRSEKEEKRIRDIIKRADPEELIKNRESLTTSEYEEAMKRFNLDKKAKEAMAHFDINSFNDYLKHYGILEEK